MHLYCFLMLKTCFLLPLSFTDRRIDLQSKELGSISQWPSHFMRAKFKERCGSPSCYYDENWKRSAWTGWGQWEVTVHGTTKHVRIDHFGYRLEDRADRGQHMIASLLHPRGPKRCIPESQSIADMSE